MMMSGTLTLASGKTVKATAWADGTITWEQMKMIRHGSGTAVQGFVQRKATPKQARTFVLDGWVVDAEKAEAIAYRELSLQSVKVLADIVRAEKAAVTEKVAYARISNLVHLADVAPTASARAYWTRKAAERQAA